MEPPTTRLGLTSKPTDGTDLFGSIFPTAYAADLQQIDDLVQIAEPSDDGELAVFDSNGFLVGCGVTPGDLAAGVDTILTDQGMILYRDGSGLAALAADTAGKSLLTGGAAANPSWGYPSHGTLLNLHLDHHTQYVLRSLLTEQGDLPYFNGSVWAALPHGTSGQVLVSGGHGANPSWADTVGAAFWTAMPGTPTRVSNTQFTITDTGNANKYDKIYTKTVILKWLESGNFKTAMVISSSYATNNVTINIVGDALAAGFTSMMYCIHRAQKITWIVPGSLGTGTALGRVHYADFDMIKLAVDARVVTAGTTGATVFDVNDDGSTIITTKPSIASGALTDLDNVCDSPTTVIAQNSKITLDVDSVSTTPPQEAYVDLWYYPEAWRYQS